MKIRRKYIKEWGKRGPGEYRSSFETQCKNSIMQEGLENVDLANNAISNDR
jgi:hypothetical protein